MTNLLPKDKLLAVELIIECNETNLTDYFMRIKDDIDLNELRLLERTFRQ